MRRPSTGLIIALAAIGTMVLLVALRCVGAPRADRSPSPESENDGSRQVAAETLPRGGDPAPATQAGVRREVVAEAMAGGARNDPTLVTIQGRAVDADGRPLFGVSVVVTGHATYEEFEQHALAHDPVRVEPAPQTTGGDGRFSVAFASSPSVHITLSLRADARVPVQMLWRTLAEGTVADVGDVPLVTGCRLSGRVVDGAGRARGRATLSVRESDAPWRWFDRDLHGPAGVPPAVAGAASCAAASRRIGTFITGVDGGFVLDRRVGPGKLTFVPEAGIQVTPATVKIAEGVPEQHVVLTVVDVPPDRCIRGRVVDESGRGIADAEVRALRQGEVADTDDDGRYTLVRDETGSGEPTSVAATKPGYEPVTAADPVAFGTRDVDFALRAGVTCEVLVREGASGRPVERFGVRIRPVASHGFEEPAIRLLHAGDHPGGRLEIAGLVRGRHELTVEADPTRFPPSPLHRFDVFAGMGPVAVDLFPLVDFEVVVRDDRGAPIAASVVEVIEVPAGMLAKGLDGRPAVLRAHMGRVIGGNLVYCVASASCGTDGVARLKTPRGAAFSLRITGDHAQLVVGDVDTARGRIEVSVPRGASVVGRVLAPDVLEAEGTRWRYRAPDPDDTKNGGCHFTRFVQIRSASDGRRLPNRPGDFLYAGMEELSATEGFRIDAVPAGDWVLEAGIGIASPGRLDSAMLPIAMIEGLTSGETRQVVIDLARFRPATLRARIVLNGRPATGRLVRATLRLPGSREPVTIFGGASRVGADGLAVLRMLPGHVTLALAVEEAGDRSAGTELRAAEACDLVGGDVVERTFSVRTAKVRVRAVDARGKGVQGVRLVIRAGEHGPAVLLPATDADGRTGIGALVAGEYVIGVLPGAVAGRLARGAAVDLRGIEDARVGSLVVEQGTEELVVRVPEGAGR